MPCDFAYQVAVINTEGEQLKEREHILCTLKPFKGTNVMKNNVPRG